MTTINVTGVSMGETSVLASAGEVRQSVPVKVKSANLLRYGPTSFGGMDVTVNPDGSLHVKGQLSEGYAYVYYDMDFPSLGVNPGDIVSFSPGNSEKNLTVELIAPRRGTSSQSITEGTVIDESGTNLRLRVYARNTPVDVDIRPMLNMGAESLPWMRPDVIDQEGGGQ